jgi:hypothetical protein
MSWRITPRQIIPAVIGEPWGGGYFAGYISHTADGVATHALIVAPRETGATGTGYTLTTFPQWKTTATTTAGATSEYDGMANTAEIVTAGIADHPAAEFCVNLSIGGFTDWYLPARYELDIAYFNLKPSTANNNTSYGTNVYAVPRRNSNWSAGFPAQTSIAAFNTTAESFIPSFHWTSTQESATQGSITFFDTGVYSANTKTNVARVRAFRRIAL